MPERVAGVALPESSGSYTRRHFFLVGTACVLLLQLGVGWSRIVDRAVLVASFIALVVTSMGEAGYNRGTAMYNGERVSGDGSSSWARGLPSSFLAGARSASAA
jgi:hypothetical protein